MGTNSVGSRLIRFNIYLRLLTKKLRGLSILRNDSIMSEISFLVPATSYGLEDRVGYVTAIANLAL